ncbi:hypothetical protein HN014_15355 [Aquimarina sp. TRL1]|uniref:hypothetical protein n=1 Tax=Aquimarina sp. (strain TRL1) TaxID=2736252 RepID=UPI00158EFA23|nr:hypothetical protein [Aquimarina sp. TRL1]QKX06227.1 hypothetical protein HN014_15355 [Aquimarina sp. TRL1]
MKTYLLPLLLATSLLTPTITAIAVPSDTSAFTVIQEERKLSPEEEKARGLDVMANQIVENIEEIDLRKVARSPIFETSYGFRWKMFNVKTGHFYTIKVNKNFALISVRDSKNNPL